MLISREELRYDWRGASFDLGLEAERKLLGWIFNQFLYGEVTGIQCGHWLYHAPGLNEASFLARQAGEELAHVRKILRILSILGQQPAAPHRAIRFLSTGMMGGSWGEHVALEMALGEGLVLPLFYAMSDTIPQPEIRKILDSAAVEEERHVDFGERQTLAWLERRPQDRKLLLAQASLQAWVLSKLRSFVLRRLRFSTAGPAGPALLKTYMGAGEMASHPVLERFPDFYDHLLRSFELRMRKLGLLREGSSLGARSVPGGLFWLAIGWLRSRPPLRAAFKAPLLTSTYLEDPVLAAEVGRPHPGRPSHSEE